MTKNSAPTSSALCLHPIGRIETPYASLDECPRNIDPQGPLCRLALDPPYVDGLLGLDTGQPILILYWLSQADSRGPMRRTSRKSGKYAGIFALRTPHRPNPVGAAVLPVERIEGESVWVRGLDCVNGTPLLDIKPAMGAEKGNGSGSVG